MQTLGRFNTIFSMFFPFISAPVCVTAHHEHLLM